MEFRILGDLEAEAGGSRLALGLPYDQKALGYLLLNAGRVVPLPRLVDALWEDGPPATAAKQVRNAASRLRRLFADAGAPGLIETRGGGYLIALAGAALDSAQFDSRVAEAEAAASAGRPDDAATLLRAALDLWRGPLLAGMAGSVFRDAATAWEERRCAIVERYHDYQLALGRHREMLAELARFAGDYPLREKPVGQLMLALYRCGRQADALSAYAAMRTRLAAELGLDPGLELQRLHQQVLTDDPALAAPPVTAGGHRGAEGRREPAVPRQLPGSVRHFTGRCPELNALSELLAQVGEGAGTVMISAIAGTAGVGKTALAVHWAHEVAEHFPDGQLYANLRGFDPAGQPVAPAEAIRGFLDAYEVPAARIPASPAAQAGLYRSLMAGKRTLVVLDNARDVAQVRPLLPGSPGCLAVVTSRSQLTGLTVAHGAQPLTLDLFSREEAGDFLARRLGAERVAAEPDAAAELIELCARLPLALSIVAARALSQPALPLAALVIQVHNAQDRLDALDSGDPATGVRPVLSWSYQNLNADTARMFRLMAVHPGPDISAPAAASIAGVPCAQARYALAELTRAHLLTEQVLDRFACHDLLRAYAGEQLRAIDSDTERHAATHRMLDHYLHTGHAAARLLNPGRDPIDLDPPACGVAPGQPAGHAEALAWFVAECQVLLAVSARAARAGFDTYVWRIPWTLVTFLEGAWRWRDVITTQRTALAAAQRQGDIVGQAYAHSYLGQGHIRLGMHDEAVAHLRKSLLLNERRGDRAGMGRSHFALGWAHAEQGRYGEGLGHARQALDLFTAASHAHGLANALNCAALCLAHIGDVRQAVAYGERALALQRELGNRVSEADSWDTLGYVHYRGGRFGQAVDHYQRALDLCRQLGGARYTEAEVLIHIGDAHRDAGDIPSAHDSWQQALLILDELEHPEAEDLRGRLRDLTRGQPR